VTSRVSKNCSTSAVSLLTPFKSMAAENIDIIKYKNRSYTAEEIISTANKMADKFKNGQQDESYGVSGNNCEVYKGK
jgi:hypothetical protein